jgi:hypothetical protein
MSVAYRMMTGQEKEPFLLLLRGVGCCGLKKGIKSGLPCRSQFAPISRLDDEESQMFVAIQRELQYRLKSCDIVMTSATDIAAHPPTLSGTHWMKAEQVPSKTDRGRSPQPKSTNRCSRAKVTARVGISHQKRAITVLISRHRWMKSRIAVAMQPYCRKEISY